MLTFLVQQVVQKEEIFGRYGTKKNDSKPPHLFIRPSVLTKMPHARFNGDASPSLHKRTVDDYSYQPVSSFDIQADNAGAALQSRRKTISNKIKQWIHCLFWIGLGAFVVYYSKIVRVIQEDDRYNTFFVYSAFAALALAILILVYITLYNCMHPFGPNETFERRWGGVEHPYDKLIYLATGSMVYTWFGLVIGLWPIWGFVTPFIISIIFIGMFFTAALVPSC